MAYELSYAGVALPVTTPEAVERVESLLPLLDLRTLAPPAAWPGKALQGLAWQAPAAESAPRIGQFYWPAGASRWATARFLADTKTVNAIYQTLFPGGTTGPQAKDLILSAEDVSRGGIIQGEIKAKMYLLPPKPIGGFFDRAFDQTPIRKDLYLLEFVDQRYFWQFLTTDAGGAGTPSTPQTWKDFINELLDALGLPPLIVDGDIDDGYGSVEPDSPFFNWWESVPLQLDAALYNVGRVLQNQFDGTVKSQRIDQMAVQDSFMDARYGGGITLEQGNSAIPTNLRDFLLPKTIQVTFPWFVQNYRYWRDHPTTLTLPRNSYPGVYAQDVDITSIPGFESVQPRPNTTVTLHTTAKALSAPELSATDLFGSTPSNIIDITNLANLLANDYAYSLNNFTDQHIPGLAAFGPDGFNDILIHFRSDVVLSRLRSRPYNFFVQEFQHSLGPTIPYPTDVADFFIYQAPVFDDVTQQWYFPGLVIDYDPAAVLPVYTLDPPIYGWILLTNYQGNTNSIGWAMGTTRDSCRCTGRMINLAGAISAADREDLAPAYSADMLVYTTSQYSAVVSVRCNSDGSLGWDLGG